MMLKWFLRTTYKQLLADEWYRGFQDGKLHVLDHQRMMEATKGEAYAKRFYAKDGKSENGG